MRIFVYISGNDHNELSEYCRDGLYSEEFDLPSDNIYCIDTERRKIYKIAGVFLYQVAGYYIYKWNTDYIKSLFNR
jgi:hypothetical protein